MSEPKRTETLLHTCLKASLPAMKMHGGQLIVVRLRDEGVKGLGLVDEGPCVVRDG
jgi:hypothetical protein